MGVGNKDFKSIKHCGRSIFVQIHYLTPQNPFPLHHFWYPAKQLVLTVPCAGRGSLCHCTEPMPHPRVAVYPLTLTVSSLLNSFSH